MVNIILMNSVLGLTSAGHFWNNGSSWLGKDKGMEITVTYVSSIDEKGG